LGDASGIATTTPEGAGARLLDITDLRTQFFTDAGIVKAVDGIDLHVNRQEFFGVVGESGCGKSVTARSIMGIVPRPGKVVSGTVTFDGRDLLSLQDSEMRSIRGNEIAMVFQEPMSSLNPVYRVDNQISETLKAHRPEMGKAERSERVLELLSLVGIPSPRERARSYPYELSGGMLQRVMIAMALACGNLKLLIADEPTTALDVTIQAQILDLFRDLREKIGMSVMLITHDLGVIAETADRIAVMYAGNIVETASAAELFANPLHPYTRGLLKSLPRADENAHKGRLYSIRGRVPDLLNLKDGCKFFDRCPHARPETCLGTIPALEQHGPDHLVRCRRISEIGNGGDPS
jgi:oligopeptide/dipeptide ABC transporter ATP-binding protein